MSPPAKTYRGRAVAVTFDAERCIHARECTLGLPQVFDVDRRPWIDADGAGADAVAAVVQRCPSGALSFERLDGAAGEEPVPRAVIRLSENGPLECRGALLVDGEAQARPRAVLCRCGASKHAPFCDGSHAKSGFAASAEPRPKAPPSILPKAEAERRDADAQAADGHAPAPLALTSLDGGPLRASGAVEICTALGRTLLETTEVYLCRCGRSGNKPFCDGSHAKAA